MSKLLTIIIPTYNMQDYLKRCLDSLIVPSDQMDQLEVLVINDGSTDNSSDIAHSYQNRFPETFRVIDKENGNYGSCVNRGLKEATGKYIKVLDADDWFDNTVFVQFVRMLSRIQDVDMILSDFQMVTNEGSLIRECKFVLPYGNVAFQEYCEKEYFALHSITYRTQLLRDIRYRQTEGISYTDNEWMYYPQCYVESCIYVNHNLYRYCLGREGQTMSSQARKNAAPTIIKLLENMILYAESVPVDQHKKEGYKRLIDFICHSGTGVYKDYLVNTCKKDFNSAELRSFDVFIAQHNQVIYNEIAKRCVLNGIPIHYAAYWRKYGKRFPVDHFREIYRRIRYGKA